MAGIGKTKRYVILVYRDRIRAALVNAFREGWQCKTRSDREADFAPILKHFTETIPGVIEMLERREKGE